jgi:2-haloalkanoic acid dehalogenase type II
MTELPPYKDGIRAVAFDCYGTLIDFTDKTFISAYEEICDQQGLACDGRALWEKYMDIWRRLAAWGKAAENPRNWQGQSRLLADEATAFRPYREEWPEHFQICFQEMGIQGDAMAAYEHVRDRLATADPFEETASVLSELRSRYRLGILSNADDDFLLPCLEKNGLEFEIIITSEAVGTYKPHAAIFRRFAEVVGARMDEVLYVGDSQSADVLGAKNAGMRVAWVNRRGAKLTEGIPQPDHEIDSLAGLCDLLL